jgi:DNA-binding MarR family transcriptional regulator
MRAEGEPEGSRRRKDIERLLASWFETSSSTITRSLAALERTPRKLVRVLGDQEAGRENRVRLTAQGEQFLARLNTAGKAVRQRLLEGMPQPDIREMIDLLQKALAVFARDQAGSDSPAAKRATRQPAKPARRGSPHLSSPLRVLAAGRT